MHAKKTKQVTVKVKFKRTDQMPRIRPSQWMRVEEVKDLLEVGTSTVFFWIHTGQLEACRNGWAKESPFAISKDALKSFLDRPDKRKYARRLLSDQLSGTLASTHQ